LQNQERGLRMDPSDMAYENAVWIHMLQDGDKWWRLANMTMNLRVHNRR
jgi:hypothetical protein